MMDLHIDISVYNVHQNIILFTINGLIIICLDLDMNDMNIIIKLFKIYEI